MRGNSRHWHDKSEEHMAMYHKWRKKQWQSIESWEKLLPREKH